MDWEIISAVTQMALILFFGFSIIIVFKKSMKKAFNEARKLIDKLRHGESVV